LFHFTTQLNTINTTQWNKFTEALNIEALIGEMGQINFIRDVIGENLSLGAQFELN
jgi:hypothetical protein